MPFSYFLPEEYRSYDQCDLKKQIKKTRNSCAKLLDNLSKFDLASREDLENIYDNLYENTRLSLMERGFLEKAERMEFPFEDYNYDRLCTKDFPCKISITNDAFIIKVPLTIGRKNSSSKKIQAQNYQIGSLISTAIAIEKERNIDDILALSSYFSEEKLTMIVKRITDTFNRNTLCDNDNLEDGRVINTICNTLMVTDNCLKMDLVKCWRKATPEEEIGTEFTLTLTSHEAKYR